MAAAIRRTTISTERKETPTIATEQELNELLGRLVAEPDLLSRLLEDPAKVTAQLGINLTDEQLAALKASDLSKLSEGLDERVSKVVPFAPS